MKTEVQYLAAILAVGINIAKQIGVNTEDLLEDVEKAWINSQKPV